MARDRHGTPGKVLCTDPRGSKTTRTRTRKLEPLVEGDQCGRRDYLVTLLLSYALVRQADLAIAIAVPTKARRAGTRRGTPFPLRSTGRGKPGGRDGRSGRSGRGVACVRRHGADSRRLS